MPPHQADRLDHSASLIPGPQDTPNGGVGSNGVGPPPGVAVAVGPGGMGAGGTGAGGAGPGAVTTPAGPRASRESPGSDSSFDEPSVKCILVGDGSIGKTSMVVSYTTNGYPTEYLPTAFDNYSVVVTVDNKPVRLQLCDTAGQDDFDKLRPLCYPNTDIFLVCFSVVSPTSFHNITDKWLPEIRQHCPKPVVIMVGTQCDLRDDVKELIELAKYGERPVTENEARVRSQEIGALLYIECSALTQKNLKEVFDSAILATLDRRGLIERCKHGSKRAKKYKCNSGLWYSNSQVNSCSPGTERRKPEKHKRSWKKLCCFV